MTVSTSPYCYQPLSEARQEIRVLTLLPGTFESETRVILDIISFTDESAAAFEALSYTWGSPENPKEIFIGRDGHDTISVTRNLAEALPYLRHESQPRVLWIDAICVNQQDLKERSSQVKRMAQIYSCASQVVVWLGPSAADTSTAMDLMKELGSKVVADYETYFMTPAEGCEEHWADLFTPVPYDKSQMEAIYNLLCRQWFERLWIWQEIQLASARSIMKCGREEILWETFRNAILALTMKAPPVGSKNWDFLEPLRARTDIVFRLCDGGNGSLVGALNDTRDAKCTDPRDRIYALLSFGSRQKIVVEPDYTKTEFEVYKDVMTEYFKQTLSILDTVEMRSDDVQQQKDWTSWVPDWSNRHTWSILATPNASSSSPAYYSIFDKILRVHGKKVTEISAVLPTDAQLISRRPLSPTDLKAFNQLASEIKRLFFQVYRITPPRAEDIQVFSQVLCPLVLAERVLPLYPGYLTSSQAQQALTTLLSTETYEDIPSGTDFTFFKYAAEYFHGRSIFTTTDGRVGLGPQAMQKHDVVTVVLGCKSLMILRPAGSQYRVVGASYCHGLMDGQGILGPLPESTRLVVNFYAELNCRSWAYVDDSTGEVTNQDPRLKDVPLPTGWRVKSHALERAWNWFVNDETGEEKKDSVDPRLTAESLRERGVDVRDFELI